jgi:hypothetical protein
MLTKQLIIIGATAVIGGVGAISYSWASWTTTTLMAVDKRTSIMASQLEFITDGMELRYGYIPQPNGTAGFKTTK